MKWTYGDSWEKFPIETGQVWGLADGSQVAVHDIFNSLPDFVRADLVFVDPPWNQGNLRSFYTKAEIDPEPENGFDKFSSVLLERIRQIGAQTAYIEMGNQAAVMFQASLERQFKYVQHWPVLYYKKHSTNILRGSNIAPIDYDFTGIDEAKCIQIIAKIEQYEVIADPCMGRGLVGLAAYANGKPFVATELNKRRLAVLLDRLSSAGADVKRLK